MVLVGRAYFSAVIDAPVQRVWDVIADFHGIANWVRRLEVDSSKPGRVGNEVGAIRSLILAPEGQQVGERLTRYDQDNRRYSYTFVDPAPFPVQAYEGTLHVLPVTANDHTFVEWYADFDADDALTEQLATAFATIYAEFAGDLADHLRQRGGVPCEV